MQTMSLKGLMELAGHEAIVTGAYRDSVGVLTCGVGHTAAAGAPDPALYLGKPLSVADAMSIFHHDIGKYEARVRSAFTRPLAQTQFDAAGSFDYETGAITYATWVKKYNAGDTKGAIAAMMSWCKPASIKQRRLEEQKLFSTGVYSLGGKATEYPADTSGHVLWSRGQRVDLTPIMAPAAPVQPQKLPPAPSVVAAALPPSVPSATSKMVQPGQVSISTVKASTKPKPSFWSVIWSALTHFWSVT